MTKDFQSVTIPPSFCQYACGTCDQSFDGLAHREAFFIYPSQPSNIAASLRECVKQLQSHSAPSQWSSWEDMSVGGQIVFCEICKAIRSSKLIVADVTTLNFNVLFEIGYAIGLGKPVLPVRDCTYERDKKLLDEVGLFDTLGYKDFTNHASLRSIVTGYRNPTPPIYSVPDISREHPIYYIRSPHETDGSMKLFSSLKKSYFRFRTFDSREMPRLSLHEAYRQVRTSLGVVAHLIDPDRTGALTHNARAAFVCGLAMASGKHVLMLQEGNHPQPIDYRDVVIPYADPAAIPHLVERLVRATADSLQSGEVNETRSPSGVLEQVDLGDVAAENEIQALARYFVRTPQFQQAKQGHARLVIGRKGSGKSALFYGVRKSVSSDRHNIVLDLKPEGHQFTKLREVVLAHMTEGLQEHTLTAFWHYLLLLEIAKKLIDKDAANAWRDQVSLEQFERLKALYGRHADIEGDFSERLMSLVDRLAGAVSERGTNLFTAPEITKEIYAGDIAALSELVVSQQTRHGNLWILFDNIDKGFPAHGLTKQDVLIVRCLLEATRKCQRDLEKHSIECSTIIFVRRDVYDLLVDQTPDRGKESHVNLDWSDAELIRELLVRRFQDSVPELKGSFDEVWANLFDAHVQGENSFHYILSRTFLRPRDVLNLTRKCVQISVSRNQARVREEDIITAEAEFSEDMLNETKYEIRDIYAQYSDVPAAFLGANTYLSHEDIELYLMDSGIAEKDAPKIIDALLWFCFLGVRVGEDEHYCYHVGYNRDKLMALIRGVPNSSNAFVIHPAFRRALLLKPCTA